MDKLSKNLALRIQLDSNQQPLVPDKPSEPRSEQMDCSVEERYRRKFRIQLNAKKSLIFKECLNSKKLFPYFYFIFCQLWEKTATSFHILRIKLSGLFHIPQLREAYDFSSVQQLHSIQRLLTVASPSPANRVC